MNKHYSRCTLVVILCLIIATAYGCGDDDSNGNTPTGPTADLSQEIVGDNPPFVGSTNLGQAFAGYVEREFIASGVATSYQAVGDLSEDGRWTFEEDDEAPYRTRVLVRYPNDPSMFSGTAIVEWFNVSGGLDAQPDFDSLEEEILRQGHAWIGISAQLIGVEGGPVLVIAPGGEGLAGEGLKAIDPARYATLEHPGDGYSFDIFTQVARALRQNTPLLGGRRAERILAAGESQSAIALTTYYNGVQPLTQVFDGFFVHSRASVSLPLVGPGEFADLAGSFGGVTPILRTDLSYPVIELQAEGDVTGVLASYVVRQPDTNTFRLWEAAGTAHADAHLLGFIADLVDCGAPINDGPLHLVAKAALRHLETWVRTGTPPPTAPRLELTSDEPPEVQRDEDGIALGGIRTPPVDAPVEVLSGIAGPSPSLLCLLLGSTTPLPAVRIAELYNSIDEYERLYANAANAAISAGFILEEDRQALIDYSDPSKISG